MKRRFPTQSEALSKARIASGHKTQQGAAERAGIHVTRYHRLESGLVEMTFADHIMLSRVMGPVWHSSEQMDNHLREVVADGLKQRSKRRKGNLCVSSRVEGSA